MKRNLFNKVLMLEVWGTGSGSGSDHAVASLFFFNL